MNTPILVDTERYPFSVQVFCNCLQVACEGMFVKDNKLATCRGADVLYAVRLIPAMGGYLISDAWRLVVL